MADPQRQLVLGRKTWLDELAAGLHAEQLGLTEDQARSLAMRLLVRVVDRASLRDGPAPHADDGASSSWPGAAE